MLPQQAPSSPWIAPLNSPHLMAWMGEPLFVLFIGSPAFPAKRNLGSKTAKGTALAVVRAGNTIQRRCPTNIQASGQGLEAMDKSSLDDPTFL